MPLLFEHDFTSSTVCIILQPVQQVWEADHEMACTWLYRLFFAGLFPAEKFKLIQDEMSYEIEQCGDRRACGR